MIPVNGFSATSIKVLIIADGVEGGADVVENLDPRGIKAAWAATGADGIALKRSFRPDVILVDLSLRDRNGIRLVEVLAADGDCGIIIVSGASTEADRIMGLEIGADDCLTKPVHLLELWARIRAVHRRVTGRVIVKTDLGCAVTRLGKLGVDLAGRAICKADGERIALTASEATALEVLIAANGVSVSRDRLSETALRRPWRVEDRSVDQLMYNIRRKLATSGAVPLIHSVRGAGYLLTTSITAT